MTCTCSGTPDDLGRRNKGTPPTYKETGTSKGRTGRPKVITKAKSDKAPAVAGQVWSPHMASIKDILIHGMDGEYHYVLLLKRFILPPHYIYV
jgi:hypothetical protein